MRTLLLRLLAASQWGASLALASGCGAHVDSGTGSDQPETGTSASGGGSTVDPPDGSPPLEPYPDPVCFGPEFNDGYYGRCCDEVHCTAPVDGACPAAASVLLSDLPPGSGTCQCEDPRGPYASRTQGDPESCCYLVGSISCDGRPLLIRGEPRLAPLDRAGSAWSTTAWRRFELALADADLRALAPAERRELGRRWAERGRNEHASVASFGRFALGLMAVGAPPELLEAAHRAAVDEVRHARIALSIASAYAGEPVGVGPLPLSGALEGIDGAGGIDPLEALTLATVVEGCVGETLSAVEAEVAAQAAEAPAVRMALQAIARDETRHAELAWAFVRWAIAASGPALREHVAAAFARALTEAGAAAASGRGDAPAGAAAHGFLSSGELHHLRQQVISDVLRPAAAALTDAAPAGRADLLGSSSTRAPSAGRTGRTASAASPAGGAPHAGS
ncbi:hypothetical protein [Sorangium sp. So ce131]|uniref:hypothetical protein n=1 Tax=Sorangium sp. So ce131 TaxID=3133282 RepID=UPI003F5EC6FD